MLVEDTYIGSRFHEAEKAFVKRIGSWPWPAPLDPDLLQRSSLDVLAEAIREMREMNRLSREQCQQLIASGDWSPEAKSDLRRIDKEASRAWFAWVRCVRPRCSHDDNGLLIRGPYEPTPGFVNSNPPANQPTDNPPQSAEGNPAAVLPAHWSSNGVGDLPDAQGIPPAPLPKRKKVAHARKPFVPEPTLFDGLGV